jgi:hypothetical protein
MSYSRICGGNRGERVASVCKLTDLQFTLDLFSELVYYYQ